MYHVKIVKELTVEISGKSILSSDHEDCDAEKKSFKLLGNSFILPIVVDKKRFYELKACIIRSQVK